MRFVTRANTPETIESRFENTTVGTRFFDKTPGRIVAEHRRFRVIRAVAFRARNAEIAEHIVNFKNFLDRTRGNAFPKT